jgi:serine protease Do
MVRAWQPRRAMVLWTRLFGRILPPNRSNTNRTPLSGRPGGQKRPSSSHLLFAGIALLALSWCVLAGSNTVVAQTTLPASIERGSQTTPEQRAELYRQLRAQAEVLEKQAAVLKTVVKLIGPTVVHVEADVSNRHALQMQLGLPPRVEESGSGIVIELGGKFYILTSRHVIAGALPAGIKINLADGRRFHPDRIWDDRETDVAVMAISAPALVGARIGNSDDMEIGDFVVAVGAPFGLAHTVTYGIISAKGRRNLELDDSGIKLQDFLQTDAAINPGNSGGPLVNLRGEVIGINTCIASSSGGNEGIGFAVPINMFVLVARQLIEHGKASRAFLGVTLDSNFGPVAAADLGLPRPVGARVMKVAENSPAAAADLREGDVILQFNNTPIENDSHLVTLVNLAEVGKSVTLSVYRERRMITVKAVVGDRTKSL